MIGVFGATGRVGREVVRMLATEGRPVRAFVRDPTRVEARAGVELVRCDLAKPATLGAALAGIDRVFLLTTGPDALAYDRDVMAALVPCRVVKLSSVAATPPIGNTYAAAHAAGERVVRSAASEWTILRPAAFMSNAEYWKQSIIAERAVYSPFGDIPRALVDPRDVAAVAVRALVEDCHIGKTYTITGPEVLTVPDQVSRLSRALGVPLRYVEVSAAAARTAMIGDGMPSDLAEGLLAELADADPSRGGRVMSTVEHIAACRPASFDDWLARHLQHFTDSIGF